ncbi:unnamed protein product [Pleuronectes platessa]|uniref:Uncharacterized protein n=1 Tax=Pleuronectes platessa TaxID=8262 RepID=A0A9N7UYV4_PLEPL|nr:unnamed protein product [Pleuronectes platessa]
MHMGQTGDRTADLQVGGRPLYPSATATDSFLLDLLPAPDEHSLISSDSAPALTPRPLFSSTCVSSFVFETNHPGLSPSISSIRSDAFFGSRFSPISGESLATALDDREQNTTIRKIEVTLPLSSSEPRLSTVISTQAKRNSIPRHQTEVTAQCAGCSLLGK